MSPEPNGALLFFPIVQSRVVACMTAILSQMDDGHYTTYIETFTGTSDLVVSTNLHAPADISICQYRDTHCFFPMSIFCRISWWSHSCFSRTWLGNMCIPLTGWPWSWYRTGTKPQQTKTPSGVCCSDLNKGLFSATASLHINSCIHTTPHGVLAEAVNLGSEQRWWKRLMWKMWACERADGVKGALLSVLWAGDYCWVRRNDRLIGSLKAEVSRGRHKGGRERKRRKKSEGEVEGTVVYSE